MSESESISVFRTAESLMTVGQVADLIAASSRSIWRWVSSGKFPAPDVRVGTKLVRWKRTTIEKWIEHGGTGQ